MIITLKGADFSANNIGVINTHSIKWYGDGIASTGLQTSIDRNTALTATVSLTSDYTAATVPVTVTMGDVDITDSCTINRGVNGQITIHTPLVTGRLEILIGEVVNIEDYTVSFTNEEFEIGAYDAAGTAVDLDTRYRTKTSKKFNQDVLLTGKVLIGETNPAQLRYVTYTGGKATGITEWATSVIIPANTEFNLVMQRSSGGKVFRGDITLTVPSGATKLYVNTLKTEKSNSVVRVGGQTIYGIEFTDGLYYYGTVGSSVASISSSSKMAAYPSALDVQAGDTVTVNVYTDATYGCVFTDANGKVISLIDNALFSGRDYMPLDFFAYEAQ